MPCIVIPSLTISYVAFVTATGRTCCCKFRWTHCRIGSTQALEYSRPYMCFHCSGTHVNVAAKHSPLPAIVLWSNVFAQLRLSGHVTGNISEVLKPDCCLSFLCPLAVTYKVVTVFHRYILHQSLNSCMAIGSRDAHNSVTPVGNLHTQLGEVARVVSASDQFSALCSCSIIRLQALLQLQGEIHSKEQAWPMGHALTIKNFNIYSPQRQQLRVKGLNPSSNLNSSRNPEMNSIAKQGCLLQPQVCDLPPAILLLAGKITTSLKMMGGYSSIHVLHCTRYCHCHLENCKFANLKPIRSPKNLQIAGAWSLDKTTKTYTNTDKTANQLQLCEAPHCLDCSKACLILR